MITDERFVALSTFRKNGDAVATTVWVAADSGTADGGAALVLTPSESGKVKRVRNDPRVTLVPCSRSGKVEPGAVPVEGKAEILDDSTAFRQIFKGKYGFEYKVIMLIERIAARRQKPRVVLRITLLQGL